MKEETVGQRIRRLRLERGMSQRELAEPGVSDAYISRLEAGRRYPSVKALRKMARKLDVSATYLETGGATEEDERSWRFREAELALRMHGDLDGAEHALLALAPRGAEDGIAAQATAGLGIIASRRGEHETAAQRLEAAVDSGYVTVEADAATFEALAGEYVALGHHGRAITLLEDCLARLERRDDLPVLTLRIRLSCTLAQVFASVGDLKRAHKVLNAALEKAEGEPLPAARVNLLWTEARLAWMAADSSRALELAAQAIGVLETSEDSAQLARIHLIAALICNLERRYQEAGGHLAHAEPLILVSGDRSDLGALRAEQAKHAAGTGEATRALGYAEEAVQLLGGDERHPGVYLGLAMALVANGRPDEALPHFKRAVDGLAARRQWREAAAGARLWADELRKIGRETEAYELMGKAAELAVRGDSFTQTRG